MRHHNIIIYNRAATRATIAATSYKTRSAKPILYSPFKDRYNLKRAHQMVRKVYRADHLSYIFSAQ
jgi:hypothetical protein